MITMDKPTRIAPGIFCPYPGGALSTVGRARATAEEWARSENYSAEVIDNVALIVTELATNSLRYVAGAAGFAVLVYPVELPGGRAGVCVEVWDADAGNPPVLGEPDFVAETGRGLFIVDSLTGGMWGWQCLADDKGKATWVVITCT